MTLHVERQSTAYEGFSFIIYVLLRSSFFQRQTQKKETFLLSHTPRNVIVVFGVIS